MWPVQGLCGQYRDRRDGTGTAGPGAQGWWRDRGAGPGARLTVPVPQAVVKALEQLAQQGRIREKTYGKQKIYFADQVSPDPGAIATSTCPR